MHETNITIFYNAQSSDAKKVVKRVKGILPAAHPCKACESKDIQQILKALDETTKKILNQQHPMFDVDQELASKDLLEILKTPLAVRGGKAVFCQEATDVYQLVDLSRPAIFF